MPALPNEEIVTNQAIILDCLNQVTENNTPLSLMLREEENNVVYQSRIQSFNIKKRQIVLKQILPSDWREKITPTTKLEIKSCMNMGNIRFYGLLTPLDDSENNPYCKLTLPKKIFRMQRRDYYRVSLARIRSSVTLKNSENAVLKGSCRNISMSGAMITFPKSTTVIEIGETIDECKISIDGILDLEFRGKVRSLHQTDSGILAGIQFLELNPSQLQPISTALNKIERQNINT
ncbi:MAG: c-di-GMP-binding flagellar brake protein YcgR [Pseudohongiellaceae bacterium]|jgi:c-di-GMP-binding flagellar brake protein YcgR